MIKMLSYYDEDLIRRIAAKVFECIYLMLKNEDKLKIMVVGSIHNPYQKIEKMIEGCYKQT